MLRGALAFALLAAACSRSPSPSPAPALSLTPPLAPSHPPALAPTPAPALAPIPDSPLFTNLDVPGHPSAVVALPNGATTRRPVIVVVHGSGDRPDWNCDSWRHMNDDYAWVICPRGEYDRAQSIGFEAFTHRGGSKALAKHIDDALAALVARWPDYVDIEHPLLCGFSLGSFLIVPIAAANPERFPRVVVIEGGQSMWTAARIKAFADGGGKRVAFGCGQRGCVGESTPLSKQLAVAGVESRVYYAKVGHSIDRPLQEKIRPDFGWLVEGDARWAH